MSKNSTCQNSLARPLVLRLTQLAAAALLLLPSSAWAQLTGTKAVPGTYPTLAAAIADLNAQGVGAGGVTFNVAAGYAETFASPTAGLLTLNNSSPNAGAATRPIVFQKAGSGANPLITAGVGTGASDAIIAVAGTDYVSFTNIDVAENAANTTPTTQMEAGYALYRASATDGSQYVQITGATITLNRANTNSVGILSAPTTAAGVAVVTTSDVTGSNNSNKFNGNTVTNAFIGISVLGSTGFVDYYTEIGSTTGNVLRGLGGSDVSAYGIRCEQQLQPKIENNTISILAGNLTTPVSGIRMDGLLIGAVLINNNTVTITSATTGTVAGIWQASSATQSGFFTRTVSNNKIQNCVLTGTGSGDVYYLREDTNWPRATCSISGNQVTGNTTTTAGAVYGIIGGRGSTLAVVGNTVANNVKAGASALVGGLPAGFKGIFSVAGNSAASFTNNTVANNQVTATGNSLLYGIQAMQGPSASQALEGNTVSGNQLQCSNGTLSAFYLYNGSPNGNDLSTQQVTNNLITNNVIAATTGTTSSVCYGIYDPVGARNADIVTGNTITGLSISGTGSSDANVLTGLYSASSNFNSRDFSRNTVGDLVLGAPGLSLSGTVKGLDISNSGTCSRVKVYGLLAGGAAGRVYGLYTSGGVQVSNSLIGDLKAPDAAGVQAVTGLYLSSYLSLQVYYNTIYLNASSTGSTFGTAALYIDGQPSNSGLAVWNNILVNTSTAAGAGGYTTAFRWVNASQPFNYSGDRNDLYAGQPSATNLLYVGGTATNGTITSVANPKQTLADYKAFMAVINREQGSVSELPPFLSTTGSSASFLHIDPAQYTQVSNAALPSSSYPTDYDGDVRSTTTPDIGADEYASPGQDVGITALVQPGTGGSPGTTQPVEVTIRNYSTTATTLPVPVQVVVTAPGGATQTLGASYASPIAAGGSANLVVGNLTVPSSGSYGFVASTTYANDPVAGNNTFSTSVTLTTPNATAWTGATSTDWYDASNWTAGVPTATLDAQVPVVSSGRYPVVASGAATAKNLALSTGATLTQSGGTLSLAGDLTNNGTFAATGGTVATTGSARQALGGSSPLALSSLSIGTAGATLGTATSLRQVLTLVGDLVTSGQTLTLRSNVSGGVATDALVVNSGGIVVGAATVQRAIDPSLNPGLGYRHYSTPVSSLLVNDLATTATGGSFAPVVNAAYNTAAVPDLVRPFPTVFGYDDSRLALANNTRSFDKGFFSPATLSEALAVGRGYTVNIPASQVVAFRGTLNNGDLTLPLTSTRNTYPDGGWQLLGNPYPAPLDYSRVAAADRAGLEGAIYVYSSTGQYTGQYRSYVNGIGNPVLPVGQGFFARAASGVVSGTMIFRNSQRLTVPSGTTFQRPAETRPLVQLTLQAGAGALADEATVYFEQGATGGFEPAFDAEKLTNPSGLNLATTQAGQQLSIDGQPALGTAQRVVPLAVGVPAPGVYTLAASQLLHLSTVPVYLRDAQAGALIDLRQQPSYQFTVSNAAALNNTRFALVFSPQQALATAPATLAEQVAFYPNPARTQVSIELPASLSRQPVTATLLDALGRVVRQQVLPAGGATYVLPLAGVTAGVYSLRLATEQGAVVKKLVVE